MLERYKDNLSKAIKAYEKQKKSRPLAHWVSTKRQEEITYIRENILARSISIPTLIRDLFAYIPVMYKPVQGGLPDQLREALTKSIMEDINNIDAKGKHDDNVELPARRHSKSMPQDESKHQITSSPSSRPMRNWYQNYSAEAVHALSKAALHGEYLGLLSLLLGPPLYKFKDIEKSQEAWDLKLRDLELLIQLAILKSAYLVFKPHIEELYCEYVFENQRELIEKKYKDDTKEIEHDLNIVFKGLSFTQKVDVDYISALTRAAGETAENKLSKHREKKAEALKKCDDLEAAYKENLKQYKIDSQSLKVMVYQEITYKSHEKTPENILSVSYLSEDQKAAMDNKVHAHKVDSKVCVEIKPLSNLSKEQRQEFKGYEKASHINKRSIFSNSRTYKHIHKKLLKKFKLAFNALAVDFISDCRSTTMLSDQLKKSLINRIKKMMEFHVEKHVSSRVYPFKWERRKIGDVADALLEERNQLANSWRGLVDDDYVKAEDALIEKHKKESLRWLKEHKTKMPEALKDPMKIMDDIALSDIGRISPSMLIDINTGMSLLELAINNYRQISLDVKTKNRQPVALNALLELISRGDVIVSSPSHLSVNNEDFYSLYSAWLVLKTSLKNTMTLSQIASIVKENLINYCRISVTAICEASSGYVIHDAELQRIDNVYHLLTSLKKAYKKQDDSVLWEALAEFTSCPYDEQGLLGRVQFSSFTQQLLTLREDKNLFCIQDDIELFPSLTPHLSLTLFNHPPVVPKDKSGKKDDLEAVKTSTPPSQTAPSVAVAAPANRQSNNVVIKQPGLTIRM